MSDDCLFCQIIDGAIPSHTVYEDETTYAFLDVNPLARGHTLVIPKAHHERLSDLDVETSAEAFGVVSEIAAAVERAVDAPASTVAVNNGDAAGQEVPHVHWHVVPQFADESARPIHALFEGADVPDDEMEQVATAIRDAQ